MGKRLALPGDRRGARARQPLRRPDRLSRLDRWGLPCSAAPAEGGSAGRQQDRARHRRGQKQAPPLDKDAILAMIESGDLTTVRGRRDQVMLLFVWMITARRSELVAIEHRDITLTAGSLDVWVPKSKTDQDGRGRTASLPPQFA